jgi:serine/threonine protein phosphatase PrpC
MLTLKEIPGFPFFNILDLLFTLLNTIFQANVGDSRAIACIAGKEESLSSDHKPSYPIEKRRIRAAGGWVEANRVNGNLALSRALGDFVFKRNESKSPEEQVVTGKISFVSVTNVS